MSLKRVSAGLVAGAMLLSGSCIPYAAEVISAQITAFAEEADAFVSGAFDLEHGEIYDGSDITKTFNMCGRTFTQGVVLEDSWRDSSVSFNVEGAQTLKFTLGHVDDKNGSESTVSVLVDSAKKQQFTISKDTPLNDVEVPVSGASKVTIQVARNGNSSAVGLGDIRTDNNTVAVPQSIPTYDSPETMLMSAYNPTHVTTYLAQDEFNSFMMNGRTYYQGVVADHSWQNSNISFNVENIKTFTCDIGHVDNLGRADTTLEIYADQKKIKQFDLKAHTPINEGITLDVADAKVLRFVFDRGGNSSAYALGNIKIDSLAPAMDKSIPEYKTAEDLVSSSYDMYNAKYFISQDEFTGFNMNGRNYYEGVHMEHSWQDSFASFNVENIDTFACDIGHIDNTGANNATMEVYVDGVKKDEIALTFNSNVRRYSVDVKDAKKLRFVLLRDGRSSGYALGDIKIDSTRPQLPHHKPEYKDGNDLVFNFFDSYNSEIYNGQDEFKSFNVNGRSYNQGVTMTHGWQDSYVYFNTEAVDSVSVTIGHIDGEKTSNATLNVINGNGKTVQVIELTGEMAPTEYTFDTSDMERLGFVLLRNGHSSGYALANFKIVSSSILQPNDPNYVDPEPTTDPEPEPEYLIGDVNGDGKVNVTDVSKAAAHVKDVKRLTGDELQRADVNNDNNVNVTDVSKIAAHVKGIKLLF